MTHAAPDPDGTPTSAADPLPTGPAAARAVDLRKVYGTGDTQVAALDGVSCEFWPGQFTAIMGPSGSGRAGRGHLRAGVRR
jgi:putative ABC transport system ATP-binding protein